MAAKSGEKKKSTRERYGIERGELYFRKKVGTSSLVMLGFAVITFLYTLSGASKLYYLVSLIFLGLGIWQFFYVDKAKVTGEEADRQMERLKAETNMTDAAVNALDMYLDEFEELPKYILYGYTPERINGTEAILRADKEDGVARSSHVQISCIILKKDSAQVCSLVKSLLGPEQETAVADFAYGNLDNVSFEKLLRECSLQVGGAEKETREFPMFAIAKDNKQENIYLAICDGCKAEARELAAILKDHMQSA